MRIAQVSPLWERVPPPGYGGIELVVSYLCDELTRRGHEVTLFASGDSETLATLDSVVPQALRLDPQVKEHGIYDMLQMQRVFDRADEFDLIHFHNGYGALPLAELCHTPVLHTLHGRFTQDNQKLFSAYGKQPYISISNAQRLPGLDINYLATVYNGIDPHNYPFQAQSSPEPYLAFLGRLSPEKGPQNAIEIAHKTGWKLKMAGKVDAVDQRFFHEQIQPLIDGEQIEYLGEVTHAQKVQLLANAALTLFPITWPEPFGLVMIESMCTGTPVLGTQLGSVPEVIQNGVSGFACPSIADIIAVLPQAVNLDRTACRQYVLDQFSIQSMVDGYLLAYKKLLGGIRPFPVHGKRKLAS
ncbi:glycosyltransferase family 4 protein [Lyngbya confervoides]|uniref:Glycosyltransferase family 4 protein n=1 Tax=Lyngbya confervoides BDU141951 TaxID=1574623 RepID=A0ABD4SY76_9CYAN|nr:glycosyltransferase family 4 protein [Lyngbya confervoides]MCM1981350.1 glycosyltransferase family 4 protein [Lyngbya confervoides BDU141951]